MHAKLSFFLMTVIITGSIFVGMTANKNHIVQADYIQKQQEVKKILEVLLNHLDEFKNQSLSDAEYDAIFRYFNEAKEQTVLQVADLKEPIDSKTKLLYQFVNKSNAVMIYVCSSIKDNKDIWNERYFSMIVELIKRMNDSISAETLDYPKMNQALSEMEVLITLL